MSFTNLDNLDKWPLFISFYTVNTGYENEIKYLLDVLLGNVFFPSGSAKELAKMGVASGLLCLSGSLSLLKEGSWVYCITWCEGC